MSTYDLWSNDTDYIYFDCSTNVRKTYPAYGIYIKNWLLVGSVNLALSPVTFFMNLMTLTALRKCKDKDTITNYVFTSLCTTDMLTGLIVQPLYGTLYLTVFHGNAFCELLYATIGFAYFFVAISFFALIAVHVERYLGLYYPFYYKTIKTDTGLIKRIILAMWIFTVIFVSLCFLTPHLIMYACLAALLAPAAFIWSCYVQVKIAVQVRRIANRNRRSVSLTQTDDLKRIQLERRYDRVESRANRVAGLILMAYTVCYIPNLITYVLSYFDRTSHTLLAVTVWTETFVFLNSIFNPLLFCLQKKDVREIAVSTVKSFLRGPATIYRLKQDTSTNVIPAPNDKILYFENSHAVGKASLSTITQGLHVTL